MINEEGISQEINSLIKDLYMAYADAYTDKIEYNGKRTVCTACLAFTETNDKIKHFDDCPVAAMKSRIKKILSKQA